MAEANFEVLRETYEAFNRRDMDAIRERCSPDIAWRWGAHFFESDRVGIDAVTEFFANWLETFPDARLEVEQIVGSGDRLVATLRQDGSGTTSGAQTGMGFAQVVSFEDGRVRDVRNYIDRGEALEAAGLGSG